MANEVKQEFTWQDVVDAEPGHIFVDRIEEGVRFLIMRGPFNLCAYVGIPETHPLAGFNHNDIPVRCHGGLTFSSEATGNWPKGYWWYGWDYGHCVYDFRELARLAETLTNKASSRA